MSDLFDLPFEDDKQPEEATRAAEESRAVTDALANVATREEVIVEDEVAASRPDRRAAHETPIATRRILTVTELTLRIRDALEAEFFEVWVEGELSNCRLWNTGHLYFTLKDSSTQLRGVIFRSALRYLRFRPSDGLRVVARGRVSVYEPKGEYQIVCEHMEPQGLGALQLAFDQLKARLQAEGLFDSGRKRPLPALPRKIGVVTSLDGAAIRDIIKVLHRRHANARLVVRPTRVQGDGSASDVARAIQAISRVATVDVVIVARGGGSIEDLWAFNEEVVARAIVRCPIPVISAVGHETDVTIADFVADVRAPTPSAAAEIVVGAKEQFSIRIDSLEQRLRTALGGRTQALGRRLHALGSRPGFAGFPGRLVMKSRYTGELSHAIHAAARAQVSARRRQVEQLRRRLETCDLGRRLAGVRTRLVAADGRLTAAALQTHHRADGQLRACANRLEALSPLGVLARGFAVCWNRDRTAAIRDAATTAAGDRVLVTLAKGELECEVRHRRE